MNTCKVFIEPKLKEFTVLFSKKVKKLDTFCDATIDKVNVLIRATTKLIEDLTSLKKRLHLRNEA